MSPRSPSDAESRPFQPARVPAPVKATSSVGRSGFPSRRASKPPFKPPNAKLILPRKLVSLPPLVQVRLVVHVRLLRMLKLTVLWLHNKMQFVPKANKPPMTKLFRLCSMAPILVFKVWAVRNLV